MNHRDLQKKQNKIALIFSLTFVLLLTIGLVGTILGFKNDLIIIGVLSILIGFGGSIASMIYVIINTIKSNKIILKFMVISGTCLTTHLATSFRFEIVYFMTQK